MKLRKLVVGICVLVLFASCSSNHHNEVIEEPITLEMVLGQYDIWYVNYNSSVGDGDVPFVANAFTLSFLNGKMYANNNLAGIGSTGDGYGVEIGYYDTANFTLFTTHVVDNANDFEVTQINGNTLELYNYMENVTYYLEGYYVDTFDYNMVFYDNIEYLLQEFVGWEKTDTSDTGILNAFDYENYLAFTPENITTFYSSEDALGTNIDLINWDYVGGYEIFDVDGYDDLKILTLDYDSGDIEEFELFVLNDDEIELYHYASETTYQFVGREFLSFLKDGSKKGKEAVSIEGRKRTKVNRKVKTRKKHLK